ncbi:hypothetical protein MTR67_035989 [Solanum verrucosum]|uniref:ethanolamine kinase n=1 Tax=Solanum verrucosum TaxID=315347 RepID=A0AAF0ZMT8_SOLVR|nr:hypothetical protein MTR67_035989 [Solanum verrucosum]
MEVAEGARHSVTAKIPYSSLTVDHSLSITHLKPKIVELCKDLFNQWSNLDGSHFSVETVSGGITNLLLKVSVREDDGKHEHMTVRLYGPNTEYVINREREMQAIQHLSAAGFGAKLLAVFGNGMVQSFIDARTLTPPESYQCDAIKSNFQNSGFSSCEASFIPLFSTAPPNASRISSESDVPNVSLPSLC